MKGSICEASSSFTLALVGVLALALYAVPVGAAGAATSSTPTDRGKAAFNGYAEPLCTSRASLCADPYDSPEGEYVGHDEPSVEFKSHIPGSGNDITYLIQLPTEPSAFPTADGASGSTWNFQLRPTFWFGLTLCDTESAPEFTKVCRPDSDQNDLGRHQSEVAQLHRQASWQRLHGAAVLQPGLCGAVRGLRVHCVAVLRRHDHR
jgi:hypothetical protein